MKYLFMFTIGPVQSFVENSRKARDMYAGSKLLSETMNKAIQWLEETQKGTILFPCLSNTEGKLPNIPNRLVAEFEGYSQEQLNEIGEQLTTYVRKTFVQEGLGLLQKVGIEKHGLTMAKRQIEQFLEIYWIFEAYNNSEYGQVYERIFKTIHDVKSIRCFGQTSEPWGRKCTLFPEYNAIFAKRFENNGKMVYPYNTNYDGVYDITKNQRLLYDVKEKEALSAIALMKRVYSSQETQIYSLRYMLLRSRVGTNILQKAGIFDDTNVPVDHIANVIYDMENQNTWTEEAYPEEAVLDAKKLYEVIKRKKIVLSSYYALIKFDGDSMGDIFRGLKNVEEQQGLSKKICEFGHAAPDILKRYNGLPVFAGGEDFLGFLPLDGLFECLAELRQTFHSVVGYTFSVGVSIAHLMQPLKEVMIQASEMEQAAKELEGKDAFAIGILKRSGDHVRIPAYHLKETEKQSTTQRQMPVLRDVQELIQLLLGSGCSKSLFFQIARILDGFIRAGESPEIGMVEALLKKCMMSSVIDKTQIDKKQLLEKLLFFYRSAQTENGAKKFVDLLNGVVFLSGEVEPCCTK